MKEKKTSADWYVAATHWLTTLITATVGGVILIFLAALTGSPVLVAIVSVIAWPFMVWLGVIYSSRYLDRTYIIKDAKHVVLLSTIYLVIVAGGIRLLDFMQTGIIKIEYIGFIIGLIIFYMMSRKYIKDNTIAPEIPTQNI